jgi:hypothetical protein
MSHFGEKYKRLINDENFEKMPEDIQKKFKINHNLFLGRETDSSTDNAFCQCSQSSSETEPGVLCLSCFPQTSSFSKSSTEEQPPNEPTIDSETPRVPSKSVRAAVLENIKKAQQTFVPANKPRPAVKDTFVTVGKNSEKALKQRAYELNLSDIKVQ